jgi:PTS system N-acetylglucosamine-specific IIC component
MFFNFMLKDTSIIDQQKIKNAGAVGVTINGKHSTQVIVGTHVQLNNRCVF